MFVPTKAQNILHTYTRHHHNMICLLKLSIRTYARKLKKLPTKPEYGLGWLKNITSFMRKYFAVSIDS